MKREQAWELLCEYTKSDSLRKHGLAVEAAMRHYARKFGDDESGRSSASCTTSTTRSTRRSTSIPRRARRSCGSAACRGYRPGSYATPSTQVLRANQ